jgi:hypothetical protein
MDGSKIGGELFFLRIHILRGKEALTNIRTNLSEKYIPKKEAFTDYTDEQIVNIQHKLNRRPRKLLNFDNPKYCFFKYINQKQTVALSS